ncbi:fused MFS/spermidine synthase [Massilia atriviolacea]|uniref:Spermidine synthase n=1 Tax=Massilia atriviolacea TaxID=2495579 RepID=A0A430HCA0_9BURK|nr:fused MFS/spermidine synthase [Massilia atriviolacea]RSZ55132.1 spermidine synthase [Massilia atriviolacea]
MHQRPIAPLQYALFAAFAFSGFSGLIYEAIWTNYLKFFLGHAAYAQALVLAMYMGGMAGGAWLAGRYMDRVKKPLLAYAAVEIAIGLSGLFFHKIFLSANTFVFDSVIPGVQAPLAVELIRWCFAGILILPQTLLLGATFPLMSVGILRAFPKTPGSSISMLYFTNSIGAVAGVLTSGFILVKAVGLPGTIMTAALINVVLAIAVYGIHGKLTQSSHVPQASVASTPLLRPMLVVALITGLSSFIYEISWIRMLSVVLGASTHAFELMLSSFILGLALGGLWLRKRIDNYKEPLVALGVIQLLMGLFALSTVLGYNELMKFMSALFRGLQPTEAGYLMFNSSSHLLSMFVMLPTTFMAGMTLPLITLVLFRGGAGESAIGRVYAFNTLGAIMGVILASMVLLPLTGLKNAIIIGAALDMVLAVYLLGRGSAHRKWQFAAVIVMIVSAIGTYIAPAFDAKWMSSSIFRMGNKNSLDDLEVLMHRDGRTATVDVTRKNGMLVIGTNGKPDASYMSTKGVAPTADEPTQVMLGALPLLISPHAKTAAMIGMGAGMSADVLLASDQLTRLDIVEIESAMVDGAKLFGKASSRVFSDPRSHIHIDDAKSFFSAHKSRYDLVISEPSDSWVSGVSNLFTTEFYQRMLRHLSRDGVLVQWVPTYGNTPILVSSVMRALGDNFSDYRIYGSTNGVMVIVAKVEGQLPELSARGLENPALAAAMARVGWTSINDVHKHEIGRREFLHPAFTLSGAPVNSDFFPYVDQNALRARIVGGNYNHVTSLHMSGVPLPGVNYMGTVIESDNELTSYYSPRKQSEQGRAAARYLAGGARTAMPSQSVYGMLTVLQTKPACEDAVAQAGWRAELQSLAAMTLPNISEAEAKPMIAYLRSQLCASSQAETNRSLLDLMEALSTRNPIAVESAARKIVDTDKIETGSKDYALNALFLSLYQQQKWEAIQQLVSELPRSHSFLAAVVASHAHMNLQKK